MAALFYMWTAGCVRRSASIANISSLSDCKTSRLIGMQKSIEKFRAAALNALGHSHVPFLENGVQEFADTWPEYVVGPKSPLAFLRLDMPCRFFGTGS